MIDEVQKLKLLSHKGSGDSDSVSEAVASLRASALLRTPLEKPQASGDRVAEKMDKVELSLDLAPLSCCENQSPKSL